MKISNIMKVKQQDGSFEDVKISYIEPNYCTAEGDQNTLDKKDSIPSDYPNGDWSHVEGNYNKAMGIASHAEGGIALLTLSEGQAAVLNKNLSTRTIIGQQGDEITCVGNLAYGDASHAEGYKTSAIGNVSHSEGFHTIARGKNQHVQGKYNIEDSNDTYAFIIGNGSSTARSNALAVKWNGDVVIKNNALPLSPVYSGYVTATSIGGVPANSYIDVTINFPAEFFYDGNQPIVIPSLIHTNPTYTPYLSITVPQREIVNEIGTATIRIFNTCSETLNPGLQYTVTPCLNIE